MLIHTKRAKCIAINRLIIGVTKTHTFKELYFFNILSAYTFFNNCSLTMKRNSPKQNQFDTVLFYYCLHTII